MEYFIIYILSISIISIFAVMLDKTAARKGKRRISENALMTLAAIGGGVAMYFSMRIIRHKTRKNKFMVGIPVIVMFEIAAFAIIYYNFLK